MPPLHDKAWASHAGDGTPCVVIGPPDEPLRHNLIPPAAARERAADLRRYVGGQHLIDRPEHYYALADQLDAAADECEKPKRAKPR